MSAKLILAPEVEYDLADAFTWYENRRTGLGMEFLSCVDACIEAIRRTPEMHTILFKNYRRGLVRRFPYGVFYDYTQDVITIYAVFHTSRDYSQRFQSLR